MSELARKAAKFANQAQDDGDTEWETLIDDLVEEIRRLEMKNEILLLRLKKLGYED